MSVPAALNHLVFVPDVDVDEQRLRDGHCVSDDDPLPLGQVVDVDGQTAPLRIHQAERAASDGEQARVRHVIFQSVGQRLIQRICSITHFIP